MRHDLSTELRKQFFQQQSPVILVKFNQGSKTKAQRELEFIAEEMAAEYRNETGEGETPRGMVALITDAWGSKIGAIGLMNGMVSWAWVTPASREDRDYLMLALDVLQAMHPTLLVWPGQTAMQERLGILLANEPHRHPGRDAYEREGANGQDPFASIPVNQQMG